VWRALVVLLGVVAEEGEEEVEVEEE